MQQAHELWHRLENTEIPESLVIRWPDLCSAASHFGKLLAEIDRLRAKAHARPSAFAHSCDIAEAVWAEREACAKLVEEGAAFPFRVDSTYLDECRALAAVIRARSNKKPDAN
jgi:hypothetical protein